VRGTNWSTLEFSAVLPMGGKAQPVLYRAIGLLRDLGRGSPARERVAGVRTRARTEEILLHDKIHYFAMMLSPYIQDSPVGYMNNRVEILDRISDDDLDAAVTLVERALPRIRGVVAGIGVPDGEMAYKIPERPSTAAGASATIVDRTLPNGMRTVFKRNDDSRVFAMHLMFAPRSIAEPAGKLGITDLLHRMFLRGTLVSGGGVLSERMGSLGVTMKVKDMAMIPYDDYYTNPSFSFARMEMPSDRWKEGVALLAEVVRYPRWDDDSLESARRELLDIARRRSEKPSNVASGSLAGILAPGHSFSLPVYGSPESIASITMDELKAFHATHLTGKKMVLTGVGPADPEEVLRVVEESFGDLPAGDIHEKPPSPPLTAHGLSEEVYVGGKQATLMLGYLFDAPDEDLAALSVAGTLMSDKLAFRLREEQGLAYRIGCSFTNYAGRVRFAASMGTRHENIDKAIAGMREMLDEFTRMEVSPDEVERTANSIRGRLIMRRMTRVNQAYFMGMDILGGRSPGTTPASLAYLLSVTPEDVQRVIRQYLDPAKCAQVIVR